MNPKLKKILSALFILLSIITAVRAAWAAAGKNCNCCEQREGRYSSFLHEFT